MPWRELRMVCAAAVAERLSDAVLEAGALSVSVEDADAGTLAEQPLFGEPGGVSEAAWARNTVVALVDAKTNDAALLARAADAAGLSTVPAHTSIEVAEQDWVRLTQSQIEPIRISQRLWVVPTWHEAPDANAISIRLDPGLAFGTGSHPTTRMCLAWLDENVTAGSSVLDYGCGSGILAIAAARLGAGRIVATDIDEQSLTAARDNAQANDCGLEICAPSALPAFQAQIVVANILTNPLKVLAPALAARVCLGGSLTLSGILESQAAEIITVYAPFAALQIWRAEEGWVCLSGTKF